MYRPHSFRAALSILCLGTALACTIKKQEAPPLMGPSEFAESITVTVSPDILTQDGASQSVVTVIARGPNGEPLRNLSLRAEIQVGGVRADFGSISARNIVTNNEGRATLTYTAPSAPSVSTDEGTVVSIVVVPIGSDFGNSSTRRALIRLVPPGIVIPPDGMKPLFKFSPSAPLDHQTVVFDASESLPAIDIVEYRWSFGDGRTSSGRTAQHQFDNAGTFGVTLTIVDAFGRTATLTQVITVSGGVAPTAAFTSSPATPLPGQQVNFNASASKPAPGRTITQYRWDFGDGSSGSNVQATHTYAAAGTYNVTLVVTDDAGHTGSVSQGVTIGTGAPTADFTFSPTAPTPGTFVNFNASSSTAAPGRTIASYFWSFGDGGSGNGVTVSHPFLVAGTYNVTLTVTDSQGQTATVTKTVTVQ